MNEEQRKILKMVEDGIISSEEAEELFEALNYAEQEKKQSYELTEQVKWDQGESYHSNSKKQSSSNKKAKFLGFIEEAFNKVKNVDLDFNFGTHTNVSHIYHSQHVDVSNIDIDIANGSFTLTPWNESDVRVECEAKVYQVSDQKQGRLKFLEDCSFDIVENRLQFNLPSKQIKTDVVMKVPSKLYEKITIKLFNGPIDAGNINTKHLHAKTTNGAISLSTIDADLLYLETANGMIKLDQSNIKEVETETINGSIRLNGKYEAIDAQTVNGSIHCVWADAQTKTGFFRTTTGSIRLSVPQLVKIEGKVESNIGQIHCNLDDYNVLNETKEVIKRSLHFEANNQFSSLLHIEAETKTGSVWILPNE
ncbi:DUF4097 family beta strand repeat-containing protein [Aquibacillus rhizosphaerae]|uniref:DUF4097 domain-containing protein n=1 Tax=Aquibacillus rhizosphaerae TaxID=3051431 RepID=A0ABT7L3U0_9BACI|nr:DUF4097 domain-containing protein [Aquibacillus sp. LR5S19]MDL4839275.1 DUF4097 domain-containing protein [Aquibacillus sp. LR5S19]